MKRKSFLRAQKRRTTLTLPVASLTEAARIARARNLNLSAVIAEALNAGLRQRKAAERTNDAERTDEVFDNYRKALSGFSPEEAAMLDGIVLEPGSGR
jgi:post-segregation antitoxin (ccd killing protein)